MDPIHRKTIRKCRVELVADTDPQSLWDGLETQGIFTPLMLEYMKAEKTRPDQVRMMLDYLQRRGPDAYEKFILVLRQAKHIHLVNKLRTAEAELRGTIPPPPEPSVSSGTCSQLPPSERNIFYGQETGGGDAEMNELVLTEPMEESGMASQVQPQPLSMNQQQPSEGPGQPPSIASSGGTQPLDQQQPTGGAVQGPSQGSSQESHSLNQQPSTVGVRQDPSMGLGQGAAGFGQDSNQNLSYPVSCSDQQPVTSGSTMPTSASSSSFHQIGYTGNLTEEYRMESFPRGYLLIINNKNFHQLSLREGTDRDCDLLKTLFLGKLGFRVSVLNNLTAREMKQKLTEFAMYPDLKDADSLAVAILSHGSENEMVYGVDGGSADGLVSLNDIFDPFNATNCQVMQGKPKFFIVNACRGGAEDIGSIVSMPIFPSQPVQADVSSLPPLESTMPEQFKRIPNLQDVLLAFSTIQGHVSWRHKTEGSWFINALVEMFGKFAYQKHVVDMLVKVNQRVSSNMSESSRVQLPAPQVMLTKDWFLNPPTL